MSLRLVSSPLEFVLRLLITTTVSTPRTTQKIIVRYISYDLKNKNMKLCRVTGLQLLGIIIANGFPPYDPKKDDEISEFNFFERYSSLQRGQNAL